MTKNKFYKRKTPIHECTHEQKLREHEPKGLTGKALVDVLQASPCKELEISLAPSVPCPVRD